MNDLHVVDAYRRLHAMEFGWSHSRKVRRSKTMAVAAISPFMAELNWRAALLNCWVRRSKEHLVLIYRVQSASISAMHLKMRGYAYPFWILSYWYSLSYIKCMSSFVVISNKFYVMHSNSSPHLYLYFYVYLYLSPPCFSMSMYLYLFSVTALFRWSRSRNLVILLKKSLLYLSIYIYISRSLYLFIYISYKDKSH
jgi:hypothetical protein